MQLSRPARPPGPRQPNRLAKRAAAVGQGAAAGRRGEPARQRRYTPSPAAAPLFTAARERRSLRADHDVEEVLAIVGDFPQLPVVIDHCLYLTAKDPTTTQHTLQKLLRLAK